LDQGQQHGMNSKAFIGQARQSSGVYYQSPIKAEKEGCKGDLEILFMID